MSTTRVDGTPNPTGTGGKDPIGEAQANAAEYKKLVADPEQSGSNDMAYYLKLQRAMMQEQQAYTAISTVLKARSDASLTAIRNSGRG